MRLYVLDHDGRPLRCDDLLAWGAFMDEIAHRQVGDDVFPQSDGTPVRVSTVFLGHDHNWSGHGPPVLWETMVFGGPLDGEMERYTSRTAADAGHTIMCIRVLETQPV